MSTNYPGSLDNTSDLINNATDATVTATTHAQAHNNVADSIIAVETELGVNPSGTYTDVASFLAALQSGTVKLAPTATQIITPTGDTVALVVKLQNALNVSNLFEARLANDTIVAFIDRLGNFSAQGIKINGTALAASHLSNGTTGSGAVVLATSPTLAGSPTAPTPTAGDSSTKLATTAFVANALSSLATNASGTLAARPAASTLAHGFYYATDQAVLYYSDGTSWFRQGLPAGSTTYMFGAAAATPTGWVRYDGSTLPGSTDIYADLYAHLGNTLTLPDTRGRVPIDLGTHVDVATIQNNDGVAVANRRPKHRHSPHQHQYQGTGGSGGSRNGLTVSVQNFSSPNTYGPNDILGADGGSGNPNDALDAPAYYVGLLIAKL